MTSSKRKAFSMIELLLGICIFALAILPLIWLGDNQNKGAYSVGKHMMAGQLATSFLDEAMKGTWNDTLKFMEENRAGKRKVLDNENITGMIQNLDSETAEKDMKASFKKFQYSYSYDDSYLRDKILKVSVEVFYLISEGNDKTEQSVKLSALKFGDKNE